MKLMVVVGTRPEVIRLSEFLRLANEVFELTLIHTGQNFSPELCANVFEDLCLPIPDFYLGVESGSVATRIGEMMARVDDLIDKIEPDAFLILGDTNSCLTAYSAKRRKIPVFHVEAGNRCFDQRVPEEINRKLVDHLADINICYTGISKRYLDAENFPAQMSFVLGSPLYEVLSFNRERIENSLVLESLGISAEKFVLVSLHRDENISNSRYLNEILQAIIEISQSIDHVVITAHPRLSEALLESKLQLANNILIEKPFCFSDYCKLQLTASVTISDSGSIVEESSMLGFKALNLRVATERPEGFNTGICIYTFPSRDAILRNFKAVDSLSLGRPNIEYENPSFSSDLVKMVFGLTEKVKADVWRENKYY